MAQCIVDLFEPVKINDEESCLRASPARAIQAGAQTVKKESAIR